jgi:hypothetical protein
MIITILMVVATISTVHTHTHTHTLTRRTDSIKKGLGMKRPLLPVRIYIHSYIVFMLEIQNPTVTHRLHTAVVAPPPPLPPPLQPAKVATLLHSLDCWIDKYSAPDSLFLAP